MDFKDILRIALHPLTLAALGGYGGRYVKQHYKVKVPDFLAMGGGAVIGYAIGKLVAPHLAPPAPTPAQVQNGGAAVAVLPGNKPADAVDLVFAQGDVPRALPAPAEQQQPQGADDFLTDLSDLSPSYAKSSYDTSDIDELVGEAEETLRQRRGQA